MCCSVARRVGDGRFVLDLHRQGVRGHVQLDRAALLPVQPHRRSELWATDSCHIGWRLHAVCSSDRVHCSPLPVPLCSNRSDRAPLGGSGTLSSSGSAGTGFIGAARSCPMASTGCFCRWTTAPVTHAQWRLLLPAWWWRKWLLRTSHASALPSTKSSQHVVLCDRQLRHGAGTRPMCRVSAAVSLSSTATRRWTRCGFTSVTAQQQSAAANSTLSTLHPDFQRLPSVDYDPVMYDAGARTGPAQIMGNASVGMATLRRCARPTATGLDHNIKTPLRPPCLIERCAFWSLRRQGWLRVDRDGSRLRCRRGPHPQHHLHWQALLCQRRAPISRHSTWCSSSRSQHRLGHGAAQEPHDQPADRTLHHCVSPLFCSAVSGRQQHSELAKAASC